MLHSPNSLFVVALLLLLALSVSSSLGHRVWGGRSLLFTALAFLILLTALFIGDHARRLGTPFQYDEPLWITLMPFYVAVLGVVSAVRRAAGMNWSLPKQILTGFAAGVVVFIGSAAAAFVLVVAVY